MIVKRITENIGAEDGTMRILGVWDTMLDKGMHIKPHLHHEIEEVYYILEDKGSMTIEDEVKDVEEGDLVYTPPGTAHTVAQAGEMPLRFVTLSVDVTDAIRPRQQPTYFG